MGIEYVREVVAVKGYRYRFSGHGFNLVKVIYRIIGNTFEPVFYEDRVEFVDQSGAVFMVLFNHPEQIRIDFRISVPKMEGVEEGHLETEHGLVKIWSYQGDKVEDAVFLSEIALANYVSHHHSIDE
jgi:hypothetical protein